MYIGPYEFRILFLPDGNKSFISIQNHFVFRIFFSSFSVIWYLYHSPILIFVFVGTYFSFTCFQGLNILMF